MQFETWYDRKDGHRITAVSGSGMKDTYRMFVDEDGRRELRRSGEYNLYAEIQSYKDSCSIEYILSRFASGDDTALSRVQGIYGDFTQMPTTMAEVCQRVIDAEHLFNHLPVDVRAEFDFSPSQFFAQIGSEKVDRILNPEKYAQVDVVQKMDPAVDAAVGQVQNSDVSPKGDGVNA